MPKPFVDRDGYGASRQYKSISRWNKLPPLPLLPDDDRAVPETTDDLREAYWHGHLCECPCCEDRPAATVLKTHRMMVERQAAIPAARPAPELPHLPEDLLQANEKAEQSTRGRPLQ